MTLPITIKLGYKSALKFLNRNSYFYFFFNERAYGMSFKGLMSLSTAGECLLEFVLQSENSSFNFIVAFIITKLTTILDITS